jgi:signal transduction histidine kinase/predicted RNA-binding protein with RPS1 domain/ActR/RegA family two-component response regulator
MTSDRWPKTFKRKYHPGKIVVGKVVGLEDYGAFVELEPDIFGLVHVSEIPGGTYDNVRQLLWIDDLVEVCIKDIDVQNQRISLSITERLRRLQSWSRGWKNRQRVRHPHRSKAFSEQGRPQLSPSDPLMSRRIQQILIVDDDEEFASALAVWLHRLGYQVAIALEAQDVLAKDLAAFDLVFLDVDLPDRTGPDMIDTLYTENPRFEIILVTGRDWTNQQIKGTDDLEVARLLLKPLDYGEVKRLLVTAEEGPLPRVHPEIFTLKEQDKLFLKASSRESNYQSDIKKDLLQNLKNETQADVALLLSLSSQDQHLRIENSQGFDAEKIDSKVLQNIVPGIVRGIVSRGEEILEDSVTSSHRFDRMLSLIFFESCVAVPVPVMMSTMQYALFLLDRGPGAFTKKDLQRAKTVSYQLAVLLQREIVSTQLRDFQKFLLVGQLSSSLLHELRNKLNRIETQTQLLDMDCTDLSKGPHSVSATRWSGIFRSRIEKIALTSADLRNLTHQYLGLVGKDEFEEINVNEVLRKAQRQIAPMSRDANIDIEMRFDTPNLRTATVGLRLEQVLLNVLLNAVQLMAQQERRGRIEIKAVRDARDSNLPIKIRITDEGPGIHARQRDWIFQMGTSTREEGTGLGLFVSRSLMESIGGRISIEKSYMFVGTTFLIELPVISKMEVARD